MKNYTTPATDYPVAYYIVSRDGSRERTNSSYFGKGIVAEAKALIQPGVTVEVLWLPTGEQIAQVVAN